MSEAGSVQLHITASVSTVTTSGVRRALAPCIRVSPFPFQVILNIKQKSVLVSNTRQHVNVFILFETRRGDMVSSRQGEIYVQLYILRVHTFEKNIFQIHN